MIRRSRACGDDAQRAAAYGRRSGTSYSVHTALGMTASGAKGTTRDEMTKVLHLPDDKVLVSGDMGRFYGHPRKDFELSVANALWAQDGPVLLWLVDAGSLWSAT